MKTVPAPYLLLKGCPSRLSLPLDSRFRGNEGEAAFAALSEVEDLMGGVDGFFGRFAPSE